MQDVATVDKLIPPAALKDVRMHFHLQLFQGGEDGGPIRGVVAHRELGEVGVTHLSDCLVVAESKRKEKGIKRNKKNYQAPALLVSFLICSSD